MRFLYPLGLLGLIGIPILIIIYIIKSKYMEQTISSTYIWRMSERFLKRKRKISKFAGLISLLLQILIVTFISLIIAHPVIVKDGKGRDYLFVLDGSASMNIMQGNQTRFDIAKDKIEDIIESSYKGSTFTLIYVGDSTRIVYEGISKEESAVKLLNNLDETYLSNNCLDSLAYAQYYFNNNTSIQNYLVTDKPYDTKNINLINVSNQIENYGVINAEFYDVFKQELDGTSIIDNTMFGIKAYINSYESTKQLTIEALMDNVLVDQETIIVEKNTPTAVELEFKAKNDYSNITIRIKEKDSLMKDNEYILYNLEKELDNKILLVSDSDFLLRAAIYNSGNYEVTVMTTEEYKEVEESISGYGLYIYDSYNPKLIPSDGAIWTFKLTESIEGFDMGYVVQDYYDNLDEDAIFTMKKDYGTLYEMLIEGCIGLPFTVHKYVQYGVDSDFVTLFEYNGLPMIFAGSNEYGNRQVGFSFNLTDSNFAITFDFITLIDNLLDYSFPPIIEENVYTCGDKLYVNVLPGCETIEVTTPKGNFEYMNHNVEMSELELKEAGTYSIKLKFYDNNGALKEEKTLSVFVKVPEDELISPIDTDMYLLAGEPTTNYRDGIYDNIMYLYILLAIVFIADWMVYCYEQYQLR